MTDFVALRNGGRSAPPPSFRAKKTRPAFLSDLGSDRSEVPAKREATREMFFKGDKNISDDRLDRRYTQFAEYEKFKNDPTKTKLVEGTTNLFQAATPGGMTLADKANQLAMKFGPKPSEIMSDIGKGVGNFMGAVAEKGTPMMQFLKAMGSGIQNFFSPNTMQVPSAVGTPFQTMNFDRMAQDYTTLGPIGQAYYSMYINAGRSADEALRLAQESEQQMKREGFSDNVERLGMGNYKFTGSNLNNGGIATLQQIYALCS